jgi:hypothetical protein
VCIDGVLFQSAGRDAVSFLKVGVVAIVYAQRSQSP